ncbi:MAG: hypothetical protein F9K40_03345 [Kofleriaceae bacterium]|nr:MAG: hypothetical protein F9K40_03345 [Kofleriaceae bacterium]
MHRPLQLAAVVLLVSACVGREDPLDLGDVEDEVLTRDHRNPSTGGSAHTIETSTIMELPVALTAGRRVTYETRNRSAGSDPVLHLLAPVTKNGPVNEVARDDDSAGDYNARLTFVPATSGTYRLVVRAAWKGKGGTADLLRDRSVFWPGMPFGGGFQRFEDLRADEELITVPLPNGTHHHTLFLVDDDGRIFERHESAPNQSVTRRFTSALSVAVAMVGPNGINPGGPLRLVRNDHRLALHDPDEDLLGTELEASIGTCSRTTDSVGNFECSSAADMRDTDGDGLRDDIELLGKVTSTPYQFLPRWGADPRHKDLFLEVDFLAADDVEPTQKLSPEDARAIATAFGDPETHTLYRLINAMTLRNPDFEPGIRLHFDLGTAPTDPADATLYGNWGGHNRVPPVCSGSTCVRAHAIDVWSEQMHVNRLGVFHYLGGTPGAVTRTEARHVANNIPLGSAHNAAHETGHSLGLGHNGPFDGEPIDANCKPTYPSLMNYAYGGWDGFSDGEGISSINNVSLNEDFAVNPSTTKGAGFLTHLATQFDYDVDYVDGHVDWNRDGIYSAAPVRAYANNDGSGCEFTKYNLAPLTSVSTASPALVRLGNYTFMLSLDQDGELAIEYTTDDLSCPTPATYGCGSPPLRWWSNEAWLDDMVAFDAHRIVEGGVQKILIVYRDDGGTLYETKFTMIPFGFSTPQELATASTAVDELSLAGDESRVYLAYKRSDTGRPMLKVRTLGYWAPDEEVRGSDGNLLVPMGAGVSPALLEAGPGANRTLYAAFSYEFRLRLYTFDPVSRRFSRSPWDTMEDMDRITGKPALAWVPMPAGGPLPGRLYLFSLRSPEGAPQDTVVEDRMLVANHVWGGNHLIGLSDAGEHQSSSLRGYGLDLLFEPGVDTNLRLLLARKQQEDGGSQSPRHVELRPKADGIIDFEQRNWNDWEIMRVELCNTLVSAGSTGLGCPTWIW